MSLTHPGKATPPQYERNSKYRVPREGKTTTQRVKKHITGDRGPALAGRGAAGPPARHRAAPLAPPSRSDIGSAARPKRPHSSPRTSSGSKRQAARQPHARRRARADQTSRAQLAAATAGRTMAQGSGALRSEEGRPERTGPNRRSGKERNTAEAEDATAETPFPRSAYRKANREKAARRQDRKARAKLGHREPGASTERACKGGVGQAPPQHNSIGPDRPSTWRRLRDCRQEVTHRIGHSTTYGTAEAPHRPTGRRNQHRARNTRGHVRQSLSTRTRR